MYCNFIPNQQSPVGRSYCTSRRLYEYRYVPVLIQVQYVLVRSTCTVHTNHLYCTCTVQVRVLYEYSLLPAARVPRTSNSYRQVDFSKSLSSQFGPRKLPHFRQSYSTHLYCTDVPVHVRPCVLSYSYCCRSLILVLVYTAYAVPVARSYFETSISVLSTRQPRGRQ